MPLTSAAEAKAAVALNNCPLNVFNPFSDGFMFYTLGPALYEGLTVAAPQSIDHAHDEVKDAVGRDSVAVYAIQGSHVFHKSVLYVGTGFVVGDYEDTYELLTGKDAGDGQILSTEDYRNVLSAAMFPGLISRKNIAGRQKIVDNQVDVVAPKEALVLPRSLGAKGVINVESKIKNSPYAIRQAEALGQHAQKDVDNLLVQLANGNANPGIGTRALGNGFFELRGRNAGRVIIKQIDDHNYDIVGKFQGHAMGDAANSNVINRLMGEYSK